MAMLKKKKKRIIVKEKEAHKRNYVKKVSKEPGYKIINYIVDPKVKKNSGCKIV